MHRRQIEYIAQPTPFSLISHIPYRAYYTVDAACTLKGVKRPSGNGYRYFLPCGGKNSLRIRGREVWTRSDVIAWLRITDITLVQYLERYGIIVPQHIHDTVSRAKRDAVKAEYLWGRFDA